MKVKFNDYQNKSIRINNQANIPKKINILKKYINNSLYISSSLPKTNRTLQKYINQKLSLIKNTKNFDKLNNSKKPNIIYEKARNSTRLNYSQRSKEKNIVHKNMYQKIYNKKNIPKNENNNFNYPNYNINKENESFNVNISAKRKQNSKQSKIINSGSTSAGLSISSNKIDENVKYTLYEYNINNYKSGYKPIEKNDINDINITYDKKLNSNRFNLDESNYFRHKINNFNYETGSDDNFNENNIFLKCDNYSSLTFGNSFSYSNSKRSKSTKRNNNEDNINNTMAFYYQSNNKNNNYINKLKEENEALKKELKESNDEISLLKYQIKELKEVNLKKNSRNVNFPPNLWNKRHIKYEIMENKNNFNDIKNIKEFSLDFNITDKIKFKKDFLEKINNKTLNQSNIVENRKIINVKKNMNLKKKIHKKIDDDCSTFCFLDQPCEKITECISNLKI